MEQFDHGSKTSPTDRSRVWLACSIAVAAVTAGGIVLLGFRVANEGEEPPGLNWWFVTWFCVGLAYSVVGAALERGRLVATGALAVLVAAASPFLGFGVGDQSMSSLTPTFFRGWSVDIGAASLLPTLLLVAAGLSLPRGRRPCR